MGWEGPITNRQLNAWTEWFQEEWNNPSRTDHYLMKIVAELEAARLPKGRSINADGLKINFTFGNEKPRKSKRPKPKQKIANQQNMKRVVIGWARSSGMVTVRSPEELKTYREEERRKQRPRNK